MEIFLQFISSLVNTAVEFVDFVTLLVTEPFISILSDGIDSNIFDVLISLLPSSFTSLTLIDIILGVGINTLLALILVKFLRGIL